MCYINYIIYQNFSRVAESPMNKKHFKYIKNSLKIIHYLISVLPFFVTSLNAQNIKNKELIDSLSMIPAHINIEQSLSVALTYNLDISRNMGIITQEGDISRILSRFISPPNPVLSAFALSNGDPVWMQSTGLEIHQIKSLTFYQGESRVSIWHLDSQDTADKLLRKLYKSGFSRYSPTGILTNIKKLEEDHKKEEKAPSQAANPFHDPSGKPIYLKFIGHYLLQSTSPEDLKTYPHSIDRSNLLTRDAVFVALKDVLSRGMNIVGSNYEIIQMMIISPALGQGEAKQSNVQLYGPGGAKDMRLPLYKIAALADIQNPQGDKTIMALMAYSDCGKANLAGHALTKRFNELQEIKDNPSLKYVGFRSGIFRQSDVCIAVISPQFGNTDSRTKDENSLYTNLSFEVLTNKSSFLAADLD